MLKINNQIVPRNFINRHIPRYDEVYGRSKCLCGVVIEAIGPLDTLIKSPSFKKHLVQQFRVYKHRQRGLLGGNANG